MQKKIKIEYAKTAPKGAVLFEFHKDSTRLVEQNGQTILKIQADPKKIDRRNFVKLIRTVVRTAKSHKIKHLAREINSSEFPKIKKISDEELSQILAENLELANYEYNKFKTKPKEGHAFVEKLTLLGTPKADLKRGIAKGQTVGEYANLTRDIANTPGGDMTPKLLASAAKKAAKGTALKVSVLGGKKLKELKAGALLGVAQGSKEEPQMIIMEHSGGKKSEKPIVLVGKGVTFDSGGLNIKTGPHMLDMHLDMSGGAAVIGAMALISKLKAKRNVVGIVPAVENMPSGESFRPGDVLTSMSGKTIDVINTDAEGRLILADGITYAKKKFDPELIVDVATLTGAALVAVGERSNVIMTPDEKLQNKFMKWGEESGDYMWPLPCWDDYQEDIKGRFGDISNLGKGNGGGTIAAGMFLKAFAEDTPWVHIDMAPRMVSIPSDNLATGAAGEPVRFFLKLVENY